MLPSADTLHAVVGKVSPASCVGHSEAMKGPPMLVEIWSDVVCPWCAVGKARFESALADFPHADDVEVRWRSFELDPDRGDLPADLDYVGMLADKYDTSRAGAQQMVDRMTATGAAEGIDFRFDLARPGNTFDAHRVLHLAADHGLQQSVKDRFLAGYHTEGVDVADHDELVRLATEAGLDAGEVRDVLGSDIHADAVRADEQQAREFGIRGVPFFVFDRTHGLSGAQPTDVMRRALDQLHAATAPSAAQSSHDHAPGEACTDDACTI